MNVKNELMGVDIESFLTDVGCAASAIPKPEHLELKVRYTVQSVDIDVRVNYEINDEEKYCFTSVSAPDTRHILVGKAFEWKCLDENGEIETRTGNISVCRKEFFPFEVRQILKDT